MVSESFGQLELPKRKMTQQEFYKLKQKEGVYEKGKNYNITINGYGTGLRPPTEEEWQKIRIMQVLIDGYKDGTIPVVHDNSSLKWFPPVGNQDGEGSCVSWACGYYTKTFQEAKEHNWDLSSCVWEGGYYGYPSSAYQGKIFSPDFIYHQVNNGVDNGSWYSDNMNLLENIGCCSWDKMPYNPQDTTSWPGEEAWREAPLYRSQSGYGYMWVNSDAGIEDLKQLLADTNLAVISVDEGQYSNMTSNDLWNIDNYTEPNTNHANTVVGYDDNYGPYTEDGETRYGAFKVVNSWGKGSWENVDDGFYYISYECMKQRIEYIFYYENLVDYTPEMIAVFNLSHNYRGECDLSFGIGETSLPDATKKLNDDYYCNGGNWPFPANNMAIDITEFVPCMSESYDQFYIYVYDSSSAETGVINSFSVEIYEDYQSGIPSAIYSSSETPVNTINNNEVIAKIITGDNVIAISPNNLHVTEEEGYSYFNVICNSTSSDAWSAAIVEGSSWFSITAGSSGSGNGTVTVYYTQNESDDSRTGKIRITSDWASNSPQEATITQDGTADGIIVNVTNPSGMPAENATIEVYSDTTKTRNDLNNYYGYTDNTGTAILSDIPDGQYTVLVYSYSDHFMFVLENVDVPGQLDLAASDLTPVDVYTYAKDGSTPISSYIWFVPFSGTYGDVGMTSASDGHETFYVSNWMYNGIAAICFGELYHLVKFGQNISDSTSITFNPVSMPTGVIYASLDNFLEIILFHWCGYSIWSYVVHVQNGDNMVYSTANYNISPELVKYDNEDHIWEYNIRKNTLYYDFEISNGLFYTLEAGGEFTATTIPENDVYQSGQEVNIDNCISDSYDHTIGSVWGYLNDQNSPSLTKDIYLKPDNNTIVEHEKTTESENKNRQVLRYLDNKFPENLFSANDFAGDYSSIYPSITVTDPNSSVISEDNSYWTFYNHEFTLPDPAVEGTYSVELSLDTGPHQGIITGSNSFSVGILSEDISLTIGDIEGYAGNIVSIPVVVDSGFIDVAMLELHISYCNELLDSLVSSESSFGLLPGDVNDVVGDHVNIVWVYSGTTMEVPDADTLIVLNFQVGTGAMEGQTCTLEFTGDNNISDPDENAFTLDLNGGTFTVVEGYQITGYVSYCGTNIAISNVEIALTGDTELNTNTDNTGEYQVDAVQGNVAITPSKSDEIGDINGFDLLRLKNILLGVHTPTACETWVGDCNGDDGVNGFDLLRLKNYLLGIAVDPPIATWGFDPGDYSYSPIIANMADQNFTAILFGDVNLSWGTISTELTKVANGGKMAIGNYYFDKTGNIHLPVYSNLELSIGMLDWCIEYDTTLLAFKSIESRFLESGDYRSSEGQVKIVWVYSGEDEKFSKDEMICTLVLQPKEARGSGTVSFAGDNYISKGDETPYDLAYGDVEVNLTVLSLFEEGVLPSETTLYPNYPNPFNPTTTISYYLSQASDVEIKIFNIRGETQKVYTYANQSAGFYQVEWNTLDANGSAVPSGIYLYRLSFGDNAYTKRMLLMK